MYFKSHSLFLCSLFNLSIIFSQIFVIPSTALSAPTGDSYLASANELADIYTNYPLTFDGVAEDVNTIFDLTRITERFVPFAGIPSGPVVTYAGGGTENATAWQNSGHILEFKVTSTDADFISFSPTAPVSIEFKDIDLNATGPGGGIPKVIGIYFDFNSGSTDLNYRLGFRLYGQPFASGRHPLEANKQVVYFTSTGVDFDNVFTELVGNKLKVFFSSNIHFQDAPFYGMLEGDGLGLTSNHALPPVINEMLIGVLITGLPTAPAGNQGDFDGDGDVDGSDFLAWQRGYGKPNPAPSQGDADADNDVDGVDLGIWKDKFGDPIGAPAAPSSAENITVSSLNGDALSVQAPTAPEKLLPVNDTNSKLKPSRKNKNKKKKKPLKKKLLKNKQEL